MSISVTIPVGPFEDNKRWLQDAIDSINDQTTMPSQLVIVDDGANLGDINDTRYGFVFHYPVKVWKAPWRMGISHSFNIGVMLAQTECVYMLGSDDTLEPTCLEACYESYLANDRRDAYYSTPIRYMDDGSVQTIPCNAAMVTKGFWRKTGGFPIESALGSGDAALLSILMVHFPNDIIQVGTVPLYNYRRHPDIHTYKLTPWWDVVNATRDKLTALYTPPTWTENF